MNVQISPLIFFNLVSCILGYIVAIILWRYPIKNHQSNRLLSASFFFLTLAQTIGLLVETRFILEMPHLFRVGNLCALLFMPLSWMYMRRVMTNRSLQWKDLIHTLPALVYIVDYFPFFILGAAEKRIVILDHINVLSNILQYQE